MLTDKQVEDRRLGIGGSDVSIIFGLSEYKTPYELYLEKAGLKESVFKMTEPQYWGHKLEPVIREEFALRNNVSVQTPDTLIHNKYPFLRANIDGFINDWNSVLEIKCSNVQKAKEWGEDGSDIIPLAYLLQVAHYCLVTNADAAHIAVLIGGNDYREYKYIRDLPLEVKVIDASLAFWNSVQSCHPPKAMTEEDLKLIYPDHKPLKTITVDDKLYPVVLGISETKKKIKELTNIEDEYRFQIMQYMQDSECLVDYEGKPLVTWKSNRRGARTLLIKY